MEWQERTQGLADPLVFAIVAAPHPPERLFAATGGGVFRSNDAVRSWQTHERHPQVDGDGMNRLAIAALFCAALPIGCALVRAPAHDLPPPPLAVADDLVYRLLPGDRVVVKLIYTPGLTEEVVVLPDGTIMLPLVGEVEAGGHTVRDLTEKLRERYAETVERPDVSVQVREFGGQRVYVGGEVRTPNMLPLGTVMSVADAVFAAGGLLDTAAPDSVVLLRRRPGGGGAQAFRVDLEAGLFGESELPLLQPYDVVFVPKSRIAQLNEYVEQYINRIVPRSFNVTYGLGF